MEKNSGGKSEKLDKALLHCFHEAGVSNISFSGKLFKENADLLATKFG